MMLVIRARYYTKIYLAPDTEDERESKMEHVWWLAITITPQIKDHCFPIAKLIYVANWTLPWKLFISIIIQLTLWHNDVEFKPQSVSVRLNFDLRPNKFLKHPSESSASVSKHLSQSLKTSVRIICTTLKVTFMCVLLRSIKPFWHT